MSEETKMPSRAEIEDAIIRAHRLRAEFITEMFLGAFKALRAIPARVAAALHHPAHG